MRYFLDMNIPVYYCFQIGNHLERKAVAFVENKGRNSFILCKYIRDVDFPKWLNRMRIILMEFNAKILDSSYIVFSSEESSELWKQDKVFLNKMFSQYTLSKDKDSFVKDINRIFSLLRLKVNYFIKNNIDSFFEGDIDFKLWSEINIYLQNISDAKVIASGILEHQKEKVVLFTADKKDWNRRNVHDAIKYSLFLSKKYKNLPEIEYLQNFK